MFKDLIRNSKYKTDNFEKSEIHEIKCNDFTEKCYVKTKRGNRIHYSEHSVHMKYFTSEES